MTTQNKIDVTQLSDLVGLSLSKTFISKLPEQPLGEIVQFSSVITLNGNVRQWGRGSVLNSAGSVISSGWLGTGEGSKSNRDRPTDISFEGPSLPTGNVKKVLIGGENSFILFDNGQVWGAGENKLGQLGLGNTVDRNLFNRISIPNTPFITDIFLSGVPHSDFSFITLFMIDTNGALYAVGCNNVGQMGNGGTGQLNSVQLVFNGAPVKKVVSVYKTTYIITTANKVMATGSNAYGQLGLNSTQNQTTFTYCKDTTGNDITNVVDVVSFSGSVYTNNAWYNGYVSTFIIKSDGTLWAAGYNGYGQLGVGDKTNRTQFTQVAGGLATEDVISIDIGGARNMAVIAATQTGKVFTWGENANYTVGDGTQVDKISPYEVVSWSQGQPVPWLGKVKKVAMSRAYGTRAGYILTTDGQLYGAGENANGILGAYRGQFTTKYDRIDRMKLLDNEYIDDFVVLGYNDEIHVLAITNFKRPIGMGSNQFSETGTALGSINRNVYGFSDIGL